MEGERRREKGVPKEEIEKFGGRIEMMKQENEKFGRLVEMMEEAMEVRKCERRGLGGVGGDGEVLGMGGGEVVGKGRGRKEGE